MAYIVVAGGLNVDIGARPFGRLIPRESNPGEVRTGFGGVGRNIAFVLARLGARVELLTALGGDVYAAEAEASCASAGIGLSRALRVPRGTTSAYVYLTDARGEMYSAVCDAKICEELTPDYFASCLDFLNEAALVVADANLPAVSLRFLAEHLRVPLFADPVSAAKAERLRPILSRIHTLKPNTAEAELLSGVPVADRVGARRAAQQLIAMGVRRVFLSMGKEGLLAAAEDDTVWQPALPARAVTDTGVGDALMAALAWSWLRGEPLPRCAAFGAAAAALAAEAPGGASLSAEAVLYRAGA